MSIQNCRIFQFRGLCNRPRPTGRFGLFRPNGKQETLIFAMENSKLPRGDGSPDAGKGKHMQKRLRFIFVLLSVLAAAASLAEVRGQNSQPESLGDLARKAREEKA